MSGVCADFGLSFGVIADTLAGRQRSLVGRPLGLSVAAR